MTMATIIAAGPRRLQETRPEAFVRPQSKNTQILTQGRSGISEDPGAFVDWDRIKNVRGIEAVAAAVDRKKVAQIVARMAPDLLDIERRNTRDAYCSDISQFLAWCVVNGLKLSDITFEHITNYVIERPSTKVKQLSRRSLNRRMIAVRLLFDALGEADPSVYGRNPVRKRHFSKAPKPRPKSLPRPQVIEFIRAVESIVDKAAFAFLLFTGCRQDEISDILVGDTELIREGTNIVLDVHVRKGKGRKERTVHLGGLGLEILEQYLTSQQQTRKRQHTPDDSLLCNHAGLAWSPRRLRKRWDHWRGRLAHRFDTKGWRLHRLRHTFLSAMAEGNATIWEMQKISGHSSLNSLLYYVETPDSKTRASYFLTIGKLHE